MVMGWVVWLPARVVDAWVAECAWGLWQHASPAETAVCLTLHTTEQAEQGCVF